MFYTVQLCKNKKAYETRLKQETQINMLDAEIALKKLGYETIKQTPVIFVAKREHVLHVYPSGRILIEEASYEEAEKLAKEAYDALGINKSASEQAI